MEQRPIDTLTLEEKQNVCSCLTDGIALLYIMDCKLNKPMSFVAGLMRKDLDEYEALALLKKHVNEPQILTYLNSLLVSDLKFTIKKFNDYYLVGLEFEIALSKALTRGYIFYRFPNLFFKIANNFFAKHKISNSNREKMRINVSAQVEKRISLENVNNNEGLLQLENDSYRSYCLASRKRIAELEQQLIDNSNDAAKMQADKEATLRAQSTIFHLNKQIEKTKAEAITQQQDLKIQVAKLTKSNTQLQETLNKERKQLLSAQSELQERKPVPTVVDVTDASYLKTLDDTSEIAIVNEKGHRLNYTLCCVESFYDNLILSHVASLDAALNLKPLTDSSSKKQKLDQSVFTNGPSEIGSFGIWLTSTTIIGGPLQDNITQATDALYQDKLEAIEVVTVSNASDCNELFDILKSGFKHKLASNKVMFCTKANTGRITAALCHIQDLKIVKDTISFTNTTNEIPVYEISSEDVLWKLYAGHSFFSKGFAGVPKKVHLLKDPYDLVKGVITESINFESVENRAQILDNKDVRALIDSIPPEIDLLSKIMDKIHCSYVDAQIYLNRFIKNAEQYINAETIEDRILHALLRAKPELRERAKSWLRKDWEKENEALFEESESKLAKQSEDLKLKQQSLKDVEAALAKNSAAMAEAEDALTKVKAEHQEHLDLIATLKNDQESELNRIIEENEQRAAAVEKAIAERIQKASENAADFIADMTIFHALQSRQSIAQQAASATAQHAAASAATAAEGDATAATPAEAADAAAADAATAPAIVLGAASSHYQVRDLSDKISKECSLNTIEAAINNASRNLVSAGVVHKLNKALAEYMCAAYMKKQPLLLAGPNAFEIVEAVASAITGMRYGVLSCDDNFNAQELENIGAAGESMVVINNLFASNYVNRLPEILAKKNIFFVVTHPYKEDLQVEPKSLFNFMLPLITDFFVDKSARDNLIGCKPTSNVDVFATFPEIRTDEDMAMTLRPFASSSLTANKLNELFKLMYSLVEDRQNDTNLDHQLLLGLMPLAYVSHKTSKLEQLINDPANPLQISKSLKNEINIFLEDC